MIQTWKRNVKFYVLEKKKSLFYCSHQKVPVNSLSNHHCVLICTSSVFLKGLTTFSTYWVIDRFLLMKYICICEFFNLLRVLLGIIILKAFLSLVQQLNLSHWWISADAQYVNQLEKNTLLKAMLTSFQYQSQWRNTFCTNKVGDINLLKEERLLHQTGTNSLSSFCCEFYNIYTGHIASY